MKKMIVVIIGVLLILAFTNLEATAVQNNSENLETREERFKRLTNDEVSDEEIEKLEEKLNYNKMVVSEYLYDEESFTLNYS